MIVSNFMIFIQIKKKSGKSLYTIDVRNALYEFWRTPGIDKSF